MKRTVQKAVIICSVLNLSPKVYCQQQDDGSQFNFEIKEDTPQPAQETNDQSSAQNSSPRLARPFWGANFASIGVWRPGFDKVRGFSELYSGSTWAPMMSGERLFFTGLFGVGVRVQAAFYNGQGFSLDPDASSIDQGVYVPLLTSPTRFIVVPLHLGVVGRLPLWWSKRIVLGFGGGVDRVFHQEVVEVPGSDDATESEPRDDSERELSEVVTGWKSLARAHLELGFRIGELGGQGKFNPDPLGLQAIYLSGIAQYAQNLSAGGLDLSGLSYSIMLSFELE